MKHQTVTQLYDIFLVALKGAGWYLFDFMLSLCCKTVSPPDFSALQVDRYALKIFEKRTLVNEEIEVDVENQTEVIRVPQHNDVDAMEIMNDFNAVSQEL